MNDQSKGPRTFKRREFLASASAASAAFFLAGHETLAGQSPSGPPRASARPRITSLRLKTAAPLEEMRAFYHEQLGLAVLEQTEGQLTIAGGSTKITFEPATEDQGDPFYHFAFNIPENKIRAARDWQRARSPLLPVPENLRDPDYPEDVVHFRNWNAHSVFFFDPAENVVEYIARHDLQNPADGPFTSADIQYASEIAFIVDDVTSAATGVQDRFELGPYRSSSEQFHAVGDEHGLLLVFKRGRSLSMAHPRPKLADVHPVKATIRGNGAGEHRIDGFPYEIRST